MCDLNPEPKRVKQTKRKHIMNSKAVYKYKVTVGPQCIFVDY